MAEFEFLFKVLVIGHKNSGKTSLIARYTDGVFKDDYTPTSTVDFRTKTTEHNGRPIKLQIWDTPGHEGLKSFIDSYYKDCHGIMIVFDVTDRSSYDRIFDLFRDIERYGPKGVPKLLVGNKSDLAVVRCVTAEEAREDAAFFNMKYIDTSADEDCNVAEAFETLCKKIYAKESKQVAKKDKPCETSAKCAESNEKPVNKHALLTDKNVPEYAKQMFRCINEMNEKLEAVDNLKSVGDKLCQKIEEIETRVNKLETRGNVGDSETKVNRIEKRKINFKTAHSRSFLK